MVEKKSRDEVELLGVIGVYGTVSSVGVDGF